MEQSKMINKIKIKKIIDELSEMNFDENQISKKNPNYESFTKRDVEHYYDILNILPKTEKKLKVLEVGIGYGYLIKMIKIFFDYDLYGIELPTRKYVSSEKWINILMQDNIKYKLCDLTNEKIPFERNFFDIVLMCEIIEHLPIHSLSQVFREVHKILKTGGTLIVTTPNLARARNRYNILFGKSIQPQILEVDETYSQHIREYTASELVALLSKMSFEIQKVYYSDCWERDKGIFIKILLRILPSLRSNIMIVCSKS